MRLLADENFPDAAVLLLRQRGHDVKWIRTDSPGVDDQAVMACAEAEQRILLTFDKDFGFLAFRSRVSAPFGIVLFRINTRSPHEVAQTSVTVIESRTDWAGHFSVIEESRIRMTAIPQKQHNPGG